MERPGRAGSGWGGILFPEWPGCPPGWQRHICTCPTPGDGMAVRAHTQDPGTMGGSECKSWAPLPRPPFQSHTFCQDLPINACCPSRPKLVCAVQIQRNFGGEREGGFLQEVGPGQGLPGGWTRLELRPGYKARRRFSGKGSEAGKSARGCPPHRWVSCPQPLCTAG